MKDLIRVLRPYILLVQETKMEEQALLQAAPSFWHNAECIAVSSRGASGGIATLWDPSKAEIVSSATSPHWIFTEIIFKGTNL